MKRLNQTESPIFVIYVVFVSKGNSFLFLFYYWKNNDILHHVVCWNVFKPSRSSWNVWQYYAYQNRQKQMSLSLLPEIMSQRTWVKFIALFTLDASLNRPSQRKPNLFKRFTTEFLKWLYLSLNSGTSTVANRDVSKKKTEQQTEYILMNRFVRIYIVCISIWFGLQDGKG